MEFESLGWESFKEYASEQVKVSQDLLSTIEFGLSPFVPFSQEYAVYHDKIENGFGVHASSDPSTSTEGWKTRIEDYGGPDAVAADVERAPGGEIQANAQWLARRITIMLEQEGIAKEFETGVREEVSGRATARLLMSEFGDMLTDAAGLDPTPMVTEELTKLGGETFDLYAGTEPDRDVLDYNLAMIARQVDAGGGDGADFVAGVRTMETTTMTRDKRFQLRMLDTMELLDLSEAEAWEVAVNTSVIDVMSDSPWNFVEKGFKDIYKEIKQQKKDPKQFESLEYFARQMLSRFAGLEAGTFGSPEDALIFQAPIGRYSAGVASIRPVIKDGFLTGVDIKTWVLGGADFQALVEANPGMWEKHANTSYASNAQLLLWDYGRHMGMADNEIAALSAGPHLEVANRAAGTGERFETLGSSLITETEVGLGNAILQSTTVAATEVIGSKEATDIVEKQVKAFFKDKNIATQFEAFYKEAMSASSDVTQSWKSTINASNRTVGGGSIYANDPGPYENEKKLEGIGIPFWFLIGRDVTGFEKFKKNQTHSADKFAATNKVREGKKQGVQMKRKFVTLGDREIMKGDPSHLAARVSTYGEHMAVKDPRGTGQFAGERTWRADYAEQEWRREFEEEAGIFGVVAPKGSLGVINDDMSAVENILANQSRAGGYNRDSRGRFI